MYEILLTRKAQRFYEKADPPLVRRINRCFNLLQDDPYNHPNIKRLRGNLSGYFRYRIGDWRVLYEINSEKQEITIYLILHRREVY